MDEFLLETLRSVSSEFATGTGEHFVLDRLEQYPGELPFAPATTPHSDETSGTPTQESTAAPLRLDPALAAEIAAEVERSRMRRATPSEDSLERLAEQLEAFELTRASHTEPIGAEQSPTETATQNSINPEDEGAEEHATEDRAAGSAAPHHRQRRRTMVLIGVGMLAALVAGVILFQQQWLNQVTGTTSDTSKAQAISRQDTVPPPRLQQEMQHQGSISPGEKRTITTAIDTLIPQKHIGSIHSPPATATPTQHASNTRSSSKPIHVRTASGPIAIVEDQPDGVAITEPPALPPPKSDGTFVIQLCSTPSYADALRWKRYAEERASGKQVTITERLIRQLTYYRVRVGVYGSQIEAEQAVRSLGLSLADVWIVQIK